MRDLIGKKIIAVHAHPDDEAIWTGGLIAELSFVVLTSPLSLAR